MDIVGGILAALLVVAIGWLMLAGFLWLHRPSRDLAGPGLRLVPDLVRLIRRLLADETTPRGVRLALGALLAYLLFPIDLIPDFLPGIGAADDLILVALVLRWAGRRVGVDDLARHWSGDPKGFAVLRRLLGL